MAAIAHHVNRTNLVHEARVVLTISDTPPRQMAWTLGLAMARLGFWLMGFAGTDLVVGRVLERGDE